MQFVGTEKVMVAGRVLQRMRTLAGNERNVIKIGNTSSCQTIRASHAV